MSNMPPQFSDGPVPQSLDDVDCAVWLQRRTLPMELAPVRTSRLKQWLEAHGFAAVEVRYNPVVDRFRILMRRGAAQGCSTDTEAEDLLRRAAEECGAEPKELIALVIEATTVLASFRGGVPTMAGPKATVR